MLGMLRIVPRPGGGRGRGGGMSNRRGRPMQDCVDPSRLDVVLPAATIRWMTYDRLSPALMPATLHTVAITVARMKMRGIPAASVLKDSGVTEADLKEPSRLVTHAQELVVFGNALALSGDPRLGLEIGAAMHIYSYGMLGYSMLVSSTLGEALACAEAFPLLLGSYFDVRVRVDGDEARITASDYHYRSDLTVMNAEMCLASMWAIVRDVLAAPVNPLAVTLALPRPEHASAYPQYLGCEGRFDEAENALVFPEEWLARPLPLAEPVSHHMARDQCARLSSEWEAASGNPVVARALRLLHAEPRRFGTAAALADALHVSERTLRRKLASAGTSFQDLLDRARQELARDFLSRTRLPVAEIAERLGYSEAASFRAAFKRWTGQRPVDLRR